MNTSTITVKSATDITYVIMDRRIPMFSFWTNIAVSLLLLPALFFSMGPTATPEQITGMCVAASLIFPMVAIVTFVKFSTPVE